MRTMLKIEWRRALTSRGMMAALGIGTVLALSQIVTMVLPMLQYLDYYKIYTYKSSLIPHAVFCKWIGGECVSLQNYLYFLLLPILAALPFAGSYFTDCKSGYLKNIYLRTRKIRYLIAKFSAVFLSGGMAVVLPLLLNLGLTAALLPSLLPRTVSGFYAIDAVSMWADLFYTHPYVYIALYMAVIFAYAGLLASVALVVRFFVENRFVVMLAPFLLYLFVHTVLTVFNGNQYCPMEIVNPVQPIFPCTNTAIVLAELAGLALITGGIFFGKGRHDDTF